MVAPGASGASGEQTAFESPRLESSGGVSDPVARFQCSLSVQLRRVSGAVIGRPLELAAIRDEIQAARSHLAAITVEGEPGIGKTRLLVAAAEMAAGEGFTAVAVTADEEIRGPFLLARSIFAAPGLQEVIAGTAAEDPLRRAMDALSGRIEVGLEHLPPEGRLLRTYDQASMALQSIATQRPLALLVDDLQWAEDDSLRMLRYAVRTIPMSRLFLLFAIRPEEVAVVTEAVNLVADMERMGVVRRLKLDRFGPPESAELLRQVLGDAVDPGSAATIHAQAEGVPFIVEEIARTYRDAGLIQHVDAGWSLARNAERLVPSAVRTLIGRRAARLPDDTRAAMGDAALLGRSFSLRDLQAVRQQLGDEKTQSAELADALEPARAAGLLIDHQEGGPADFTFSHEQVREFASASLTHARRRAVHAAIIDLLGGDGEPQPASLAMLAEHALAAGDDRRAARFSVGAAQAALDSNAPEEALRVVERALPAVSSPQERRALLTARDDAFAALRRPSDRLEGLAELGALAGALRDPSLELEVMLRRSAALRLAHDHDTAADLARRVRALAAQREDRPAELAACLELGQALLRSQLGEAFGVMASEVDLAGAEEAFIAARDLAASEGDDASEAAALRELGIIATAKVRDWFVAQVQSGATLDYQRRLARGESVAEILKTTPIAPMASESERSLERALELYQHLGDRRGVMSTIIATAFISYAPVIHLTSSARHIEEIRRVTTRMASMVTESERARADLQMLYGVHVYARAKVVPDLAIPRGEDAFRAARVTGDRAIEFQAAGGLALAHVELGEIEQADRWLGAAASAAAAAPTPTRTRQLEFWRGIVRGAAGDARAMRAHLERAAALASDQRQIAARGETLARLALDAARLGSEQRDDELLEVATHAAEETKRIVAVLPGHAPWGAQAEAALADVALARGDASAAAVAAGAAIGALQAAQHEDVYLEVLLPAARGILAGGAEHDKAAIREWLQIQLAGIAQRTLDEDLRVRWLRGPVGRELARLAGPLDGISMLPADGHAPALAGSDPVDLELLHLLTEGHTDREIAERLGLTEETVGRRLGDIYTRIGASTRAEATSFAFRGSLL